MHTKLEEAKKLASEKYYTEALYLLREIEEAGEMTSASLYLTAAVLWAIAENEEAKDYLTRCLEIDPEHSEALRLRDLLQNSDTRKPIEHRSLLPGSGAPQFDAPALNRPFWARRTCPNCQHEFARERLYCPYCHEPIPQSRLLPIIKYAFLFFALLTAGYLILRWIPISTGQDSRFFQKPSEGSILVETSEPGLGTIFAIHEIRFKKKGILPLAREEMPCSGTIMGEFENLSSQWLKNAEIHIALQGQKHEIGAAFFTISNVTPGATVPIKCEVAATVRPRTYTLHISNVDLTSQSLAGIQPAGSAHAPMRKGGFFGRFAWGRFFANVVAGMIALFLGARFVVLCSNSMKWNEEWKEDAILTTLATIPLLIVTMIEFYLVAGIYAFMEAGVNLGPIIYVAMAAPTLLYFGAVAFFFKRGCLGTLGIVFASGLLKPLVLVLIEFVFRLN